MGRLLAQQIYLPKHFPNIPMRSGCPRVIAIQVIEDFPQMAGTRTNVKHRSGDSQNVINLTGMAQEPANLNEKSNDFDFEGVKFGDGAMVLAWVGGRNGFGGRLC